MAYDTNNTLITTFEMLCELAITPFRAVGRGISVLVDTGRRIGKLRALPGKSDASLATKGLSRDTEISRILDKS